ncbi:MAG: AAA domain-containing protein [Bacteroidetes bacterium]|nr:AAA domain-containing protein [Bacteroidota bacterium]
MTCAYSSYIVSISDVCSPGKAIRNARAELPNPIPAIHVKSTDSFESRLDLSDLRADADRVRQQVHQIIVGQERTLDLLLTALLANGHVLIEGVPGVAKTLMAKLLARTVSAEFKRIQFTPDLMPSDILGTSVFNPKTTTFEFKRGPVFANLILIDEVNRAPAKTQAALFEVMEERQVTADGTTYPMAAPFLVFATQNPLEHEGTYRLPEAQLDRFLFKVDVGYPSLEEEVDILAGHHAGRDPQHLDLVEPVLPAEALVRYQQQVRQVHIEPPVLRYVAEVTTQTRNHQDLTLGASPRASVALMQAAKAWAAMQGRAFVTPEDVQAVAATVLRHRLILTPEQEMEGRRPDDVIQRVLERIEVPR